MVKMSTPGHDSDDSEGTVSSSECSEDESSENDSSDTASLKSLRFSVTPRRSKVTVKSKKSNKKVRFKPGDSLVLIYVIPNREMLGLKSESEDSDECGESDDESDDEDSDGGDEEEEDDDTDEDDGDDADEDESKSKTKTKKCKQFAKLIAVKQVNRRKIPEVKNSVKTAPEKAKEVNTDTNANQAKGKKPVRARPKKERKENTKIIKSRDLNIDNKNKSKNKQYKTNNAIKVDKRVKGKRGRSRLLEIRATVESSNKQETNSVVPKVTFKSDLKPSVIDVNSSVSSKQLTNRTRLQPTSFRISKPGVRPGSGGVSHSMSSLPEKKSSVAHFMASNYSSVTSVLPDSYVRIQSLQDSTVEETIKRLDPDSMNSSGRRNYAWQIANGTITSQSLRTPSILPFWDSLQNSVSENNTIKLPT